jgi:8-oxo-dGTP pyrophosphatase MutT (NUDIX family)
MEDCFHLGVKALVREPSGKLLLMEKQHRIQGAFWELPGGRIQRGESLMGALRREMEEETGLRLEEEAVPLTFVLTRVRIPHKGSDVGLILSIYRYDLQEAFVPRLSQEHTRFGWFEAEEAAALLKGIYPVEFIERLATL